MALKVGDEIEMRSCRFSVTDWGCVTTFADGSSMGAHSHDTHHYHVISHRLGYGDDITSYCVEHELAHIIVGEEFGNGHSYVLWELAHERTPDPILSLQEEVLAQLIQRWVRTNERPILGGVDWDAIKARFLVIVGE